MAGGRHFYGQKYADEHATVTLLGQWCSNCEVMPALFNQMLLQMGDITDTGVVKA